MHSYSSYLYNTVYILAFILNGHHLILLGKLQVEEAVQPVRVCRSECIS